MKLCNKPTHKYFAIISYNKYLALINYNKTKIFNYLLFNGMSMFNSMPTHKNISFLIV